MKIEVHFASLVKNANHKMAEHYLLSDGAEKLPGVSYL